MAQLRPLGDRILLMNLDKGEKTTKGGVIVLDDSQMSAGERGIRPRWAQIYAVGPRQESVKAGQWVLMEHARWTEAHKVEIDGVETEIWMGDPEGMLGTSETKPDDVA
tara:strand:+ start:211 stop:534 length:324 start_codon:yes stop_codon:yes gene_type:complete